MLLARALAGRAAAAAPGRAGHRRSTSATSSGSWTSCASFSPTESAWPWSCHDWNLALRLADELVVLRAGRIYAAGTPEEVLRGSVFEDVFEVAVDIVRRPEGGPVVVPRERQPADVSPR